MSSFCPATLFVRGKETSDEDPWDDTLLIKQYDESVSQLKQEVAKLIEVNGSGDESASSKGELFSDHKTTKNRHVSKIPSEWEVGSFCRAEYSMDGELYEGKIISLNKETGICKVRFVGYNNDENVFIDNLLPSKGRTARKEQEEEAINEQMLNVEGELEVSDSSMKPEVRKSKEMHETSHSGRRHSRRKRESPGMTLPHSHRRHEHSHSLEYHPQMPPPPPPPPNLFENFSKDDSEALSAMLMSWYMSGYHTGYYYGLKQAKTQQNTDYDDHRRRQGRRY